MGESLLLELTSYFLIYIFISLLHRTQLVVSVKLASTSGIYLTKTDTGNSEIKWGLTKCIPGPESLLVSITFSVELSSGWRGLATPYLPLTKNLIFSQYKTVVIRTFPLDSCRMLAKKDVLMWNDAAGRNHIDKQIPRWENKCSDANSRQ